MFDYTSTSKIRRKVRTNLTRIRNRVQEEVTVNMNDLSAVEGESLQQKLKRFMKKYEGTSSASSLNGDTSSESGDSVDEDRKMKKTLKQRFVKIKG